ncbi:MAG: bifunctional [glutamate--ammonia ligase]-adenylyl-L-tyrosine phosphorylase/[glutamate--ammonia-ligase] adenylyltransferase [Polyangiaceae bacterium]|nr:bifunctional [glutamate--ammonia ligase]-adenylyl-L-tyrosine phosphorylase/[glutamate--ammonia-ligase] adenylyltransferase [Polyangiaceae bacterium]
MDSPTSEALLEFGRSIDADRARAALGDYGRGGDGTGLAVLLACAFPPLAPRTAWQLEAVTRLAQEGWRLPRRRPDLLGRTLGAVGDLSDGERVARELRRMVWTEKVRVAVRELVPTSLGGAGLPETALELSRLADVALEVALAEASLYMARRFGEPRREDGGLSGSVVVGLGKLGGNELNAGSDVDIQFIYDTDDGTSELGLHEHWSRVARRVVAHIEEPTADGMVWRVDLRLRPEGSRGPIVNSLLALERYYETWGRLWERAALLRARAVAGDAALARSFREEVVVPFVFRREVDPHIATALAELLQRSRAELSRAPERDLKLGPGGIREAEFFVQTLQLIWGGRSPNLRVTGTLEALARLRGSGLVTDRESRLISDAYLLLRRVEHRVQWMEGTQTHLLPDEPDDLGRLARTLGFVDERDLGRELARARETVASLFDELAPEAPEPPARYSALLSQVAGGVEPSDLVVAAEREFGSAEMGEHLAALGRPDGLFGELTRERYPRLGGLILSAVAESPDPEQAVRYLRAFLGRFRIAHAYYSVLAEDELAVNRLVTVFGASTMVGDALVSHPDLADLVLLGALKVSEPARLVQEEIELAQHRAPSAEEDDPVESFVAALRRAKQRMMLDVAIADLAGAIDLRGATRCLSDLADEIMARTVAFVHGAGARGLVVIAMGKFGGREIGYGSDLDVLFIYEPEAAPTDSDPSVHFVRVAQRIIRLLSTAHAAGSGYELDTRLRPSGSHGMLVTSLESFARYHKVAVDQAPSSELAPSVRSSGAGWERQALIRARPCAGDLALGERVMRVVHAAAYERGPTDVDEMHRIRMRMENELGREHEGRYDLKTGRGGLLDIEFATQWLQMRYGTDARVRTPDTLQALEALHAAGYLRTSHYETFREGYLFLRRLEQRMHVLRGAGTSVIDARSPGLSQLARRMGLHRRDTVPAAEVLMSRYKEVVSAVRGTYCEIMQMLRGD